MTESNLSKVLEERVALVKRRVESGANPPIPHSIKSPAEMAPFIEETCLNANATKADIEKICLEAKQFGFAGVCVNSANIKLVASLLVGSKALPVSVVGFPLGAMMMDAKIYETELAVKEGAKEIDMVINIGALKDGKFQSVLDEISGVVRAAGAAPVKVILETALLNDTEKQIGCILSEMAGAKYVKTSTGFSTAGATIHDVRILRLSVSDEVNVKASGGIRDFPTALAMMNAGCSRIGTSSGANICSGKAGEGNY